MSGPVFNAGAIQASAKIDRSEFINDLRKMQADIRSFERNKINVGVKIDRQALKADLAALKQELNRGTDAKLTLGLNTAQAKRDVAAFRAYVRDLSATNLKIGATLAQARRDVADYRREVRGLAATNINVGADTAKARADINELKRMAGGNIRVDVDANTLAALLRLREIEDEKRRVSSNPAHVNVAIGSDAGRVIGIIGLIVSGISAISYLAPAATAALGGLFATAGIGAQVFGALGFGLSGVGDAYKAMSQDAQHSAVQVGKAHTGIESSLRSLENAQRSAAKSVEDAQRSAEHTAVTSARSVEDAQRSLARTITTNARSIEDAERTVARAQVNARQAQEDLNRARQQEISDLEDLSLRLRDTALSEEEAAINLQEAKNRLAALQQTPGTSALELHSATLAVQRAQLSLEESQKAYKDTAAESAKAAQTGVEGSDKVVAAKQREADATQSLQDAERNLTETRADADYQRQQSERQLNEARADAEYANAQAIRAVSDAQEQGAHAVADALSAVKDAQESAANSGVASANKVAYAMSKLSPEAREFAHFLYDEVRPALNSLSDSTAAEMLPRLQEAMKRTLDLQPELRAGLAGTGRTIGDLAIAGANLITSGPFRRDFADIMAANNRMLYNLGGTGLFLTDSMRSIYTVALPLLETFTQWVLTSAKLFDEWIQGKRATGELADFMELAADRAKQLWDFFVNLISTGYELGKALAPVGETVLAIANAILDFIRGVSEANPELIAFIGYAVIAFAAFTNLGKGILALGSATRLGMAGFARLGTLIESAALAAGVYTERMAATVVSSESAALAGTRVANAGEKLSGTLSKVGSALPIVGAAVVGLAILWEKYITTQEDAVTAMLKGGDAAEQMKSQLDNELTTFGQWLNSYLHFATTSDEATAAMNRQIAAMTPLEQAQLKVKQATQAHGEALRDYGLGSGQAALASAELADASGRLKDEQKKAADATKSLVDRLVEQRDIILGTIDAEIGYEDATDRLTKAVQENGRAVDIHTEAGRNNLRALNDLARSGIAYIKQLEDQGASTDEVTSKQRELEQRLYDGAIQLGMTKEEARKYVDQLNLVPGDVTTNFWANTQAAWDQINRFITDTKNAIATYQDGNVTVKFWADTGNILNQAKAAGGPIFGPGSGTSDSVPIRASHGEHMWTANEVSAVGGHGAMMNLRQQARSGMLRPAGFAAGGPIGNITTNFLASGIPETEGNYSKAITDYVLKYFAATAMGPGPGSGVERWRGVAMQALSLSGQAASNIDRLLMQMSTESGGNPTVINKWDSNWQKGTPSVGLMQVIGPTYARYKNPQFDVGPYEYGVSENPMSNIISSIRYTLAAYGSLSAGWQGHGYDQGGMWLGGPGFNMSGRPERVLSPKQTASFERLVNMMDSWMTPIATRSPTSSAAGSASTPSIGTVVMNVPYGASPREYVEHLDFELQYRTRKGVYSR
jgi:hypothetical protein